MPAAPAQAATISYSDPNCASFSIQGTAPNFTLVCGGSTGPAPVANGVAPSSCTIAPVSVPSGGATVQLNASCLSGDTVKSWVCTASTGMAAQTTTGASLQVNGVQPNTTFWAVPHTNLGGSGDLVGNVAGVVVALGSGAVSGGGGAGGGGTGGGTAGFCSQYSNVVQMNMDTNGRQDTVTNGTPFQANGVLVAKFTVPATQFPAGQKGYIYVAEFGDPPAYRQGTLSNQPCDFRGAATGVNDVYTRDLTGVAPFPRDWILGISGPIFYTVTGTALDTTQLPPGTYYFNVRNWNPYANGGAGGLACSGTCNAVVTFALPK